ncbi:MAG: FAD-dependent oxidoreductase [Alphaproteobacteria bacterium]
METAKGLAALERQIIRDLEFLSYPATDWVLPTCRPDGAHVYDVVVVGAGQGGLGTAFALKRQHVRNVLVVDRRPVGREGPWLTYARMETLRTVKELTGPDGDLPNLTFRAWYEAQFGCDAWRNLVRIPRGMWMEYLNWFRRATDIAVQNDTEIVDIGPDGGQIRLALRRNGRDETVLTRKVVLQTGLEGSGGPSLPKGLWEHLPRSLWAHSSDENIDWARIKGGRVGVLGAGASAFDNALAALDAGATEVHLFARRRELPRINFMRGIEYTGFFRYFGALDDLRRWRFSRHIYSLQVPPPPDTFEKAITHPGFRLRLGQAWRSTRAIDDKVEIETDQGRFSFDLIIFGTGFDQNIGQRAELRRVSEHVALWRDRFTPPPGEDDTVLKRQPYLGSTFELMERNPGAAPWLRHIRLCGSGSWPSMGPVVAGVNGMKFGLGRIVDGVCRDLFLEDADQHYARYLEYSVPELTAAMPPNSPAE